MEQLLALLDIRELIVGLIVAIVPGIIKTYKEKRRIQQLERERKIQQEKETAEKVSELITNYIVLQKEIHNNTQKIELLNSKVNNVTTGGIAVLCDRLLTSCHSALVAGETSMISRQNIAIMYQLYNKYVPDIHKNPNVHRLYKKYIQLPVYDDEHFNSLHQIIDETNKMDDTTNICDEEFTRLTSATFHKKSNLD